MPVLFVEVRDESSKTVVFSVLDIITDNFICENVSFDEKWWIGLEDVHGDVALFKIFTDPGNPEKTSIIAFNFRKKSITWWRNNFLIKQLGENNISGIDLTTSQNVTLDSVTGENTKDDHLPLVRNFSVSRPLQYYPDSDHFATVKHFLEIRAGIEAEKLIEYLEYGPFVILSTYCGKTELANFLIVTDLEGNVVLNERIGERLKGIGLDTFFVFNEKLFFVRNRTELVSYNIV